MEKLWSQPRGESPAPPMYLCYEEEIRKRNGKKGRVKCKSLEGDIKADGPFIV